MRNELICDGKRKIAVSCNVYNEIDCLPNFLESVKDWPIVIIPDGKWARLNDPKARPDGLSYDGTRELCSKYPNVVLLDCGNQNEEAMSNMCMKTAALYGYPYLLQVAADEFVKGDYSEFQRQCDMMVERYPQQYCFFVPFEVIHITPPEQKYHEVMRLIYNPMFIRLRDVHWIYYFNDHPVTTNPPKRYLIKGLTLFHDDSMRHPDREAPILEYQLANVPREQKLKWEKIIRGEYDYRLDLLDIEMLKLYVPGHKVDWFVTPDDQHVYLIRGELKQELIDNISKVFKCKAWKSVKGLCVLPIFEPRTKFPEPCEKCGGRCVLEIDGHFKTCENCNGEGVI